MPFAKAWELQKVLFDARREGHIADTLLLLEHDPVITLGRGSHPKNIVASPQKLAELGIAVAEIDRGGDVTFHGPGQLVAYPIFDLSVDRRDVRKYVADLRRVMAGICAPFGVDAGELPQMIGAWVDLADPSRYDAAHVRQPAKIGAIGVRISRWVTMHGFALNVSTKLAYFSNIVPCGISEHPVTSLAELVGDKAPSIEQAAALADTAFAHVFGAQVHRMTAPNEWMA
jgi:lipoyl(octanoyl) transferase